MPHDVWEGLAVLAAAAGVWLFGNGWPDLIIACALLVMFLRSSLLVLGRARRELRLPGEGSSQCS